MTTIDRRTGLEVLDHDACLALLAGEEVGRLAMGTGGAPLVFPVNYALDGETVVFRTDAGTKLDHAGRSRVAFEIDGLDREARTGWSVVVTGRLEEVTHYDAAKFEQVRRLPIEPWAAGDKAHWLRVIPTQITGRRVGARAR
jgi:uncharacterized protein